jgi:uncharacterized phage-associated protein
VACTHCTALNSITWDDDPARWTCGACGFALDGQPAPPLSLPPLVSGTAAMTTGGALLGGLAGAALAAEVAGRGGRSAAGGALLGAALGALIGGLVASEQAPPPPSPADQAHRLTDWIRAWYPYGDLLTQMKLQALAFYCHGIALAHGFNRPFGDLTFEAWEHGPVCRPIWERFRHLGSRAIERASEAPSLPPQPTALLYDVLTVYGRLDAWRLGQQTHLETSWRRAWESRQPYIDPELTRAHFKRLYQNGPVEAPQYLFDGGSFQVDGIPVQRYASLAALANALRT